MSAVTTHILDTARGLPAAGVPVRLLRAATAAADVVASGVTDADGRVSSLGPERLEAGHYTLEFDTATYFASTSQPAFFPQVTLTFDLSDPEQHYHVPLLLSPFAYSTYRGS